MKVGCFGLLLASAATSVYGMQDQPKNGMAMLTKNGYITISQPVVDASPTLTNIQKMKNNDFFTRALLSDQRMIVIKTLIKDQEWILAGSSGSNGDEESNRYRSIVDIPHYLTVAKRLKLTNLYDAYVSIVKDTKQ